MSDTTASEKVEADDASHHLTHTHSQSSHDASSSEGKEKPEAEDQLGNEDDDRRNELDRTKSSATAASMTSAATTARLPEQKPWYKQPNPLRWGKVPRVPKERAVCPEYRAGFFSSLAFSWMGPLMSTGYKRPLEHNDIYTVNPNRAVEPLTDRMRESFRRRVANGDKYPLLFAINETFFFEFWLGGFCSLVSSITQVMSPFTLRYLIQFAADAYVASARGLPAPHIGTGIGLVLGVTAMQVIQSLATNHFIYRGMLVGGMTRASLIDLIYEKSMVISGRAKAGGAELPDVPAAKAAKKSQDKASKNRAGVSGDGTGWGNGRIVNLMSVDTYRIDQAFGMFHIMWTAPISCVVTLAMLLINLTYSALAGFALLVIGVPVLTNAIKGLFVRRKAINKITDQRVSLTQEMLQSVRFVKFFGWEGSFLRRLEEFRSREISAIQVVLSIRNAIMAVSVSLPIFASMLSFITYSLTHHDLAPAQVFSSLALFNGLRMPLNMLPLVIGQVTDAWSSLSRIQEFLLAEEREEEAAFKPDAPNAVEMRNASFTWERTPTQDPEGTVGGAARKGKGEKGPKQEAKGPKHDSGGEEEASTLVEEGEPFKLQDLSFEIGRNELVAVIGTVGSGKTSLLAALAGDMRKTSGDVVLGASRAFCPQYAWIQNATVQENILFGKEMDGKRYSEVIKACALQPDLDMLPNGDMTEVGERGITISGGQKQRLNIARAIYFDADIVLLDDPLSAVDAHVGRHIFDKAILGLLKDKCRILATHQLWVLSRCDRIVWMEGGKMQAIDTFDNLMENSEGFRRLMETTAIEEKKEDGAALTQAAGDDGQAKKKKKGKGGGLMQSEERAVSSVPWSVYTSYTRASGSILNAPIVVGLLILSQGANIVTSLWLSWWTANKWGFAMGTYIGVYAGLGAGQAMIMFAFMVSLSLFGTTASKAMLRQAITRVLRAPMSFFDTTPLGRITNRFSRDVDVMDNNLTDAMRMYLFSIGSIVAVFALIMAFFYYFAIALVPLLVLFLFATSYYRASAREVKRLEAILRSTVFAKFGEGLSGVACIRAYGLQGRFVGDLGRAIDEMDSAYFLTYSNQRWLSVRLDMIGNCLVFTTGILVVTSRFAVDPSIGGLVLSYILSVVQMIQFTVRQLAEVENGMNSVERLLYYGNQLEEEEAPLKTIDVRKTWPEKGEIVFDKVEMRYRAGLPLVLQGLNMHIRGGERIGIVGRTGAGKSSIMSALFRLVELSGGHITIDGLDISTIGLHDLRSRLAIIPQDPTLFRGTVRSNLDPFGEHTDLELWSALRQADLVPADGGGGGPSAAAAAAAAAAADPNSSSSSGGDETKAKDVVAAVGRIHLDSVVEEDGLNFSLGQRQLMALARALARGSQIIVCDEATSSVDMETDAKIQATMAGGFRGRTLLCIAHRLRTIVGYDRICVMDGGRIAEMGPPLELWRAGGIFRGMCDRSGIRVEDIRGAREELQGADEAERDMMTGDTGGGETAEA